jgi:tetrahydromethanopterin S-methyltransferase subunit E
MPLSMGWNFTLTMCILKLGYIQQVDIGHILS